MAGHRMEEAGAHNHRPIITISRSMGSGARIIAEKLAADLGWSFWSKEILNAMAEDARMSRKVVEEFDEKTHSSLEQIVRSFLGESEIGGFIYIRHLVSAIKSIERVGNAVILGRGADFVLPNALHVRIDASEDVRVKNMVKFEGMTESAALAKIRRSDKDRQHFLRKVFGVNLNTPCLFDLNICMDHFTNDDAVELLKMALVRKFSLPESIATHEIVARVG